MVVALLGYGTTLATAIVLFIVAAVVPQEKRGLPLGVGLFFAISIPAVAITAAAPALGGLFSFGLIVGAILLWVKLTKAEPAANSRR
jgi:hypothetical protein